MKKGVAFLIISFSLLMLPLFIAHAQCSGTGPGENCFPPGSPCDDGRGVCLSNCQCTSLSAPISPLRPSSRLLPKILPDCDPSLAPSQGGCGIPQFIQLLKNIIDFLTIIVFPIGAGVIIWGGITIMIAGGSTERVAKGRKIIWAAVIGIAIALGAWLIINAIYLLLTGANVPVFD